MTSPPLRTWLAARLPDWTDHAYAIWRGFRGRDWDPLELDDCYKLPAPGFAVPVAAGQPGTAAFGGAAPSPALNLVLACPTCGARSNADCVTRYGENTGPHKARRDAAAAAASLGGTP